MVPTSGTWSICSVCWCLLSFVPPCLSFFLNQNLVVLKTCLLFTYSGYKLACDAAYVVDQVTKEFKDTNKKSNFESFEHFLEQRSREIGQVGLTLDVVGTIAALNDKIQAQIIKVGGATSG